VGFRFLEEELWNANWGYTRCEAVYFPTTLAAQSEMMLVQMYDSQIPTPEFCYLSTRGPKLIPRVYHCREDYC